MSPAKKKKKRKAPGKLGFWGKLFLWLNGLASLALFFSWASTYINPTDFWPAAFIAMIFPIMVLLNLAFILLWLFRLSPYFLVSLLPVVLSWGLISAYFQIGYWRGMSADEPVKVKLASYNVHGFDKNDYYNYRKTEVPRKLLDWIYEQNADIVCMQEFYSNASRGFNMLDSCKRELNLPHFARGLYRNDWTTTYMATFSRLPILDSGKLSDSNGRGYAIWTDMRIPGDTVRVINVHLRSVRLSQEADILDSKIEPGLYKDPEFRKGAKSLIRKLKRAFIARSEQTRALKKFIDASPFPVILCGDLNDTPASYTYRVLSKGMRDSFKRSGSGPANTYAGRFPSFRIDYVLTDSRLRSSGFRTHHVKASDHFPLTVELYSVPEKH